MASQDQISWLDLTRFGADLSLSEKNKYRDRLSVLIIDDVQKAISLSNQNHDDFFAALTKNGFKLIPSEIPEHRNRMALSYHNPNGSSGLNPKNFQNVFLNLGRGDIKDIPRNQITQFTAPQQSHNEWRNLFLNNRTSYQKDDQEFYIVSCGRENTLKQEYDDFIQNSSIMYLRSHQVDSMPISLLSDLGYKGNALVKVYSTKEAAFADGYDDSVIRKEKLSPFTQALSVQENGTILAFEDLREVPEIFNHLPSEHPTWGDKAQIFNDSQFTLNTLNRSAANLLEQNYTHAHGKDGIESELLKLSQDLRDLNRIALTTPSFREHFKAHVAETPLRYLRKNQEDQQWYSLTRQADGEFEKELLNPNNLFTLLNERLSFVEEYVYNLSGNHPYSALNHQYHDANPHLFVDNYAKAYSIDIFQGIDRVLEVNTAVSEPPKYEPLEFQINASSATNDLMGSPELPVIDQQLIDEMEPISLEELIAQTGLRPATDIQPPKPKVLNEPTNEQLNEIVDDMLAQVDEEIDEEVEQQAPAMQSSLDVEVDQPINVEAISNSIDNDALDLIKRIGAEERLKTALAREKYLANMEAALQGTYGAVTLDVDFDSLVSQSLAIEPDLAVTATFEQDHNAYTEYVSDSDIQPISDDVIVPVVQGNTQLDTITESGSDTLVFENPHELYSELVEVVKEATYIPKKFLKDQTPQMLKQVQNAQSYRLFAKLVLLPNVSKDIQSLQNLSVTLRSERDTIYERELLSNVGLKADLYPLSTMESRPLADIQDELKVVLDQLTFALDEQQAVINRITRIETAFSRSLDTELLVYSDESGVDQSVLNDTVTKAYQTLFSNEAYREPEKLNTLVDEQTRVMMESQYPTRFETNSFQKRLPRFERKGNIRYQHSRLLKAKSRFKKSEEKNQITQTIPARKVLYQQIGTHFKTYGTKEGLVSDISVMLKGLENITGENQFDMDSPSSNLIHLMTQFAEQDMHKGSSMHFMGGTKSSVIRDKYGFKPSEQALNDAKDKLAMWTVAKIENDNPSLKESILFTDKSGINRQVEHSSAINNQAALASFFIANLVSPQQPTLDGVKSVGWAMGLPGQPDQYRLIPYDLNTELDATKYQPMKSRNYEVALEESYDKFRLNYAFSSLNIEANDAQKLEKIAKIIRHSKQDDEPEFKQLSKELWSVPLNFEDFKNENFKLMGPENKEEAEEPTLSLAVGKTVIEGLSGDELERVSRTITLAKILADAPTGMLDYDILPESNITTAYAKTLEPSYEFKAFREYFKLSANDINVKFENPTQYVNDMSERAVQAWGDLCAKMPEMNQYRNLDIVLPTMQSSLETPVYRLLPEQMSHQVFINLNERLGIKDANNWNRLAATVYTDDLISNLKASTGMEVSTNDALLLSVNSHIKIMAKVGENSPYVENPPMYFPRLDNSQLADEYKSNINFVPKLFDLIDRNNKQQASLSTLSQAQSYNAKKIHADFLANLDYDAIQREAVHKHRTPLFGLDPRRDSFDKPEIRQARSISDLIDAQMKEPFVGVPMMLYKSPSFNANDLSHLRAVPSYIKIPSTTNYVPFENKAVTGNHFIPIQDKPLDFDKFVSELKTAIPTELPNNPFNITALSLIKDGLDNKNHPYYDNFTIKSDLNEVQIHEEMSKNMIVNRQGMKDFYRESIIFQAENMARNLKDIRADKNHPQHYAEDLSTAHVYLVNYADDKFPMLVVDHKDTNRHSISSKGAVYKIGALDLDNQSNFTLQAENIIKSPGFAHIAESNQRIERMIIDTTEIEVSPLKAQDLDPNTKELVKTRIANDLQNNIAWQLSNITSKKMSALGHALVMKPSTDTDLARFKFVDVRDSSAKKAIDEGWKVLTSHGFDSKSKKYLEIGSTELLNMTLTTSDVLPKDYEATRAVINATSNDNSNQERGYFGDVGVKVQGAHKDRYGYNFSMEDIRLMSSVETNSLITKAKIWSKPDFKDVAIRTGDMKFALLANALHDMLPGKPKLIDGSDKDIMKRVHSLSFYNDMVSGVRNATNDSVSVTDFISKLSQLSRDLNLTHTPKFGHDTLDLLYTTKKNHLGHSISSVLLDAPNHLNELYHETRPNNSTGYPYHPLLTSSIAKAKEKLINPKGSQYEFVHVHAYSCHDFHEDVVKDKQINKEFALYIQSAELTTNLIDKLDYYTRNVLKDPNHPIRSYEEVLADLPEKTEQNEVTPIPKPSTSDHKDFGRDVRSIAQITAIDGRDGVIQQEIKSSNWGMLSSTRIGEDYRQGKNTDAFDLRNTFGMNAVEFGNSTPIYARQEVTNLAYDAMRDLAKVLNLHESKISLGTGLAFASRGSKGAAAHYEPSNNIINLSGQKGSGSLAHEWFHSLDHYLGNLEKNYLLEKKFNLPTATVNATHFLSEMVAKGYQPKTPISKMMLEVIDSVKYKSESLSNNQLEPVKVQEQNLMYQLNSAKSDLQLQWFEQATQIQGTGPIFKVSGVEPKGNDLEEFLKWTLKKSQSIAENYNGKIEKVFAKDAKLCKEDSNLNGFKYACDQYSTFIEKSTPQFGVSSVTTFVKTQHPHYSEKQRKEVIEGLMSDISSQSVVDQMGGIHCKMMAVQSAVYMRDQLIKYAPEHLKDEVMVSDFIRNHDVNKLIGLPQPIAIQVSNNADSEVAVNAEKAETSFYSFARALDKGSSKAYWSTPCELFARTGEAYINKKLEDLGFKNTFLASGNSTVESPILPIGPELSEIEKKVDALVEYVGQHILQSSNVYDKEMQNTVSHESTLDVQIKNDHKADSSNENGLSI